VNPQMAKMLGYATEEMMGKHITFFMLPEDLPAYEARMEKRVKGIGGQYEQKFRHKNGHPVLCLVSAQARMDEKGTFLGSFAMLTNITERKQVEAELERHRKHLERMVKERTAELEVKNKTLQELNTALKVLLNQREDDKKDMEDRFLINIRNLVLPFVEQMKKGHLGAGQQTNLDIIETHLHNIATPLLKNIRQFNFTPKEIKVAMLVKEGKSTKEIAEMLKISTESIDVHRKNIRKKLGLSNRKANLQSHLVSLEQ
jgi:PAS domain S-box-containing protein